MTALAVAVPSAAAAGMNGSSGAEPKPLPEVEASSEADLAADAAPDPGDAGLEAGGESQRRLSPVASRRIWQVAGGLGVSLPTVALVFVSGVYVPGAFILTLPLAVVAPALAVHYIGLRWFERHFGPGLTLLGATVGLLVSGLSLVAVVVATSRCFGPGSSCPIRGEGFFAVVMSGGLLLAISAPALGALWGFEVARMRAEAEAEAGGMRPRPRPRGLIETFRLLPAPPVALRSHDADWIVVQPLVRLGF